MWAATVAPTADVQEYAILVRMADEADEAGCGVWLATSTIAGDVNVSEKTAQRRLDAMLSRKLIGLGDQRLVAHIRADRRPVVYDLLIPAACFADLAKTNARRAAKGLPLLTPESRPVQDPPSDEHRRARRSDIGKPRTRKLVDNPDGGREADEQAEEDGGTISHPADGGTDSHPEATGGLLVPDEVTDSPERGDCKSPNPGIDPGIDPGNPPYVRTSVTTAPDGDRSETGGSPFDEETRALLNGAVAYALDQRAGQAGWKRDQVVDAIRAQLDAGHAPADVARVLRKAADDREGTTYPGRIGPMLTIPTQAPTVAAAAPWAEGPVKHLAPGTPMCRTHPGLPAATCGGCKADAVAVDRDDDQAAAPLAGAEARRIAAERIANGRRKIHGKDKPRTGDALAALGRAAAEVVALPVVDVEVPAQRDAADLVSAR
jgi:hypothetical protein